MRRIQAYDLIGLLKEENIRMDLIEENTTKNYQVYQDNYNVQYLFSYDTFIMSAYKGHEQVITTFTGYSTTTSQHQGKFMRQHLNQNRQEDLRKVGYKNLECIPLNTKELCKMVKHVHKLIKEDGY